MFNQEEAAKLNYEIKAVLANGDPVAAENYRKKIQELDESNFTSVNEFLLKSYSEEEVDEFWGELSSFNDCDPDDAFDAGDN